LSPELHDGYHAAWRLAESSKFDELDTELDKAYFSGIARLAEVTNNEFVRVFVKMEIDLHNISATLRTLTVSAFDLSKIFVSGGTFAIEQCSTYEQATQQLANYGGQEYWLAALSDYQEQQHTTAFDRLRDVYRLRFTTERVHDMFSVASLFAYVLRVQQSAATIRTIMVGADTGVPIDTIRTQLRIKN
jgi:vacuolar-type H+-ATPase subunit C/Vma6